MTKQRKFAQKLREMQSVKNNGMGIQCVRDIAYYLELDDEKRGYDCAKRIFEWDCDKLTSFDKNIIKECNKFFNLNLHSYLFKD